MLQAEPLTAEGFQLYGDVITIPSTTATNDSNNNKGVVSANQGTAQRINHVTRISEGDQTRPSRQVAKLNPCFFVTSPQCQSPSKNFDIHLLERHLYSSQCFLPCQASGDSQYLVIVCLNGTGDKPDFQTLKAFQANSNQGINYHPGIWHHPMVALTKPITFLCLVHENDQLLEDCEITKIHPSLPVRLSKL